MSEKVLEILNSDVKVINFMIMAKQASVNTGCTDVEWNNARESLLCMAIQMCPEAMKVMAHEVYNTLNGVA